MEKVHGFKYLSQLCQNKGVCEVKNERRQGEMGGKRYDKRVATNQVYVKIVRPAMLYGLTMVTKRQDAELEVTELNILRLVFSVTRMDGQD